MKTVMSDSVSPSQDFKLIGNTDNSVIIATVINTKKGTQGRRYIKSTWNEVPLVLEH